VTELNSLYTPEVRQYVLSRPWPKGMRLDVIEYDYHLGFKFYKHNFIQFDRETQAHIAMLIKELMEKLRADGIPCYMEKGE
jgi:hypothetical protein